MMVVVVVLTLLLLLLLLLRAIRLLLRLVTTARARVRQCRAATHRCRHRALLVVQSVHVEESLGHHAQQRLLASSWRDLRRRVSVILVVLGARIKARVVMPLCECARLLKYVLLLLLLLLLILFGRHLLRLNLFKRGSTSVA